MDETELKQLKTKCNKLIERAQQLELEKKEKDSEIAHLQENKRLLEQKVYSEVTEVIDENQIEKLGKDASSKFVPDNENLSAGSASVDYDRILAMMQTISSQIDSKSQKKVMPKIFFKGKVFTILAEGMGRGLKVIGYVILLLLVSLAATVLINEGLRSTLFEFIKNCVG